MCLDQVQEDPIPTPVVWGPDFFLTFVWEPDIASELATLHTHLPLLGSPPFTVNLPAQNNPTKIPASSPM